MEEALDWPPSSLPAAPCSPPPPPLPNKPDVVDLRVPLCPPEKENKINIDDEFWCSIHEQKKAVLPTSTWWRKLWRRLGGGDKVVWHIDGHLPGVIFKLDKQVGEVSGLVDAGEHVLLVGVVATAMMALVALAMAAGAATPFVVKVHLVGALLHFHCGDASARGF